MAEDKKSKSPAQPTQSSPLANGMGQIDAIRDIIFGQQIQDYAREFAEIKEIIHAQGQELEAKMNRNYEELKSELADVNKKLTQLINQNQADTQAEVKRLDTIMTPRKEIGEFLQEMGRKLAQEPEA